MYVFLSKLIFGDINILDYFDSCDKFKLNVIKLGLSVFFVLVYLSLNDLDLEVLACLMRVTLSRYSMVQQLVECIILISKNPPENMKKYLFIFNF